MIWDWQEPENNNNVGKDVGYFGAKPSNETERMQNKAKRCAIAYV